MKKITLFFALIIPFWIAAQPIFLQHTIFESQNAVSSFPKTIEVDLDNDGDLDILTVSNKYKLAWFENNNSDFSRQHIIENISTHGQFACKDMDNDGWLDIIITNKNLVWYKNLGLGYFSNKKIISNTNGKFKIGDLDGDGDNDVLEYYESKFQWHENKSNEFVVHDTPNIKNKLNNFQLVDLDTDGAIDILTTSYNTNTISWYKNIDKKGNFSSSKFIDMIPEEPEQIKSIDYDHDGDLDIVLAYYEYPSVGGTLVWYENTGNSNFKSQNKILQYQHHAKSLDVLDFNDDSQLDIIIRSETNQYIWYEKFGTQFIQQENILNNDRYYQIHFSDLNQDNNLDLILTSEENISWKKGLGNGMFGDLNKINTINQFKDPSFFITEDINNDNKLDIVVIHGKYSGTISYLEQQGDNSFSSPIQIFDQLINIQTIEAKDLDQDSYNDLVVGSLVYTAGSISIIKNNHSNLDSTIYLEEEQKPIWENSAYGLDYDLDGDMDIIGYSNFFDNLVWYENIDNKYADKKIIRDDSLQYKLAKIYNDKSVDLIQFSKNSPNIYLLKNDGQGDFISPQLIAHIDGQKHFEFVDFDEDGDLDIFISVYNYFTKVRTIYLLENNLGNIKEELIVSQSENSDYNLRNNTNQVFPFYFVDIDNDGDLDLVEHQDNRWVWKEKSDHSILFGNSQTLFEITGQSYLRPLDLDNDGDLDFVVTSFDNDQMFWFENQSITLTNELEKKVFSFILSPNPTSQNFIINSDIKIKSINIYNQVGQLIKSFSHQSKYNISSLTNGIYFVEITAINNKMEIHKMIKQ